MIHPFFFLVDKSGLVVFSSILDVRGSAPPRTRDRMPTRLSLSTSRAEATDGDTRLATPSSGGRISFKGSGLPIPACKKMIKKQKHANDVQNNHTPKDLSHALTNICRTKFQWEILL
jgi:hypothetical protein